MAQYKLGLTPLERKVAILEEKLDGVNQDMKVLLVEMNGVLTWIKQQFDVNLINFDSANFKRAHHKNGQDMENLKRDLCLLGLEKLQLAKSMKTSVKLRNTCPILGATNKPSRRSKQSNIINTLDISGDNRFASSAHLISTKSMAMAQPDMQPLQTDFVEIVDVANIRSETDNMDTMDYEEVLEEIDCEQSLGSNIFVEEEETVRAINTRVNKVAASDPLATGSRRKQILTPRYLSCPVQVVSLKSDELKSGVLTQSLARNQKQPLKSGAPLERLSNNKRPKTSQREGALSELKNKEHSISIVPSKNLKEPKSNQAKSVAIPLKKIDLKSIPKGNIKASTSATKSNKAKTDEPTFSLNPTKPPKLTAESPMKINANSSLTTTLNDNMPVQSAKLTGKEGPPRQRGGRRKAKGRGRPASKVKAKSHACSDCGKKFTTAFILSEHIRIHSGERPYTCLFCSTSFRYRNYYHVHMKLCKQQVKAEPLWE